MQNIYAALRNFFGDVTGLDEHVMRHTYFAKSAFLQRE